MISGFIIVKDVVAQGYPFLESILSVLPICDELLISDGGSTDGTWEVLTRLRDVHGERIRIFRDPWPTAPREDVLAPMSNRLLDRCRGEWCLQLQANEVLHERSVREIRQLPELYPHVDMFRLPFLNILGSNILWHGDMRRRLFRRRHYIRVRGDAYDVGYARRRMVLHPRRLAGHTLRRSGELAYVPARPFYRYRNLFPRNYLEKLRRRVSPPPLWRAELEHAERVMASLAHEDPAHFWSAMRPFFDGGMWSGRSGEHPTVTVPRRCVGTVEDHPAIIQPLLDTWASPLAVSLRLLDADV